MEQAKALNALEPFLALTKSATSPRAAADLITRATSAPNTFLFTELLETPQIQALADNADFAPSLALLRIFSFGTYADYQGQQQQLPALNDAQLLKLRQLSLMTLARSHANLTYNALIGGLGLASARELEDIVISAIYAGLVVATLDPANQVVRVSSVAPLRDVAPGSIPALLQVLQAWSGRCDSTLQDIESQIAHIRQEARDRAAADQAWERTLNHYMETGGDRGNSGGAGGGSGGGQTTLSMLADAASGMGSSLQHAGKRAMTLMSGHSDASRQTEGEVAAAAASSSAPRPLRTGKRGINNLMSDNASGSGSGPGAVDEDEAMELDDDDHDGDGDGKKRASRRKL